MKQILKTNKTYKFKFAIITPDSDVYLFNDSMINYSVSKDDALTNVQVMIDKSGTLHIKGELFLWELTYKDIYVEDLEEPVLDKCIKRTSGFRLLGIKPTEYVNGWYCLKRRENVKYMLNGYKIIIKD